MGQSHLIEPSHSATSAARQRTLVDQYWEQHVVCSADFSTSRESEEQLQWRFEWYPLFREFTGLYGRHEGEIILDYGCGPGNDLVGFALYSRAKRIIGVDVSRRALDLAARRLSIHGIVRGRVELLLSGDSAERIMLKDDSVDFINCQGVLQHTSRPQELLREFYRILKPTGRSVVMVYNQDSVWLHLYTAFEKLLRDGEFPGLDAYAAFARNVDGVDCPLARCYRHEDFIRMCNEAGFHTDYVGAYLSKTELDSLDRSLHMALGDPRLPAAHRDFLKTLVFDTRGYPLHQGYHAGIGGVYRLYCWNKAPEEQHALAREAVVQTELADVRQQISQLETYCATLQARRDEIQDRCAELQRRHADLERAVEDLRQWQERVRSLPGVQLLLAIRRRILRLFAQLRNAVGRGQIGSSAHRHSAPEE